MGLRREQLRIIICCIKLKPSSADDELPDMIILRSLTGRSLQVSPHAPEEPEVQDGADVSLQINSCDGSDLVFGLIPTAGPRTIGGTRSSNISAVEVFELHRAATNS